MSDWTSSEKMGGLMTIDLVAAIAAVPAPQQPPLIFQAMGISACAELLNNLPPSADYRTLSHIDAMCEGRPTRFACDLAGLQAPFWRDLNAHLSAAALRDAVANRLGLDAGAMHPKAALLRDLPGYRIRPHPDSPRKAAVLQIYLAADDQHQDCGVRFYSDAAGQQLIARVPYLPGVGYCFAVTSTSWHGVDPVTGPRDRNSLMLVYYRDPADGYT